MVGITRSKVFFAHIPMYHILVNIGNVLPNFILWTKVDCVGFNHHILRELLGINVIELINCGWLIIEDCTMYYPIYPNIFVNTYDVLLNISWWTILDVLMLFGLRIVLYRELCLIQLNISDKLWLDDRGLYYVRPYHLLPKKSFYYCFTRLTC